MISKSNCLSVMLGFVDILMNCGLAKMHARQCTYRGDCSDSRLVKTD
jgi:hypothetical protein